MKTRTLNLSLSVSFIFLILISFAVTGSTRTQQIAGPADDTFEKESPFIKDTVPVVEPEASRPGMTQMPELDLYAAPDSWVHVWGNDIGGHAKEIHQQGESVYVLYREITDLYLNEGRFLIEKFDKFGTPVDSHVIFHGWENVKEPSFAVDHNGNVRIAYDYVPDPDVNSNDPGVNSDGVVYSWNLDQTSTNWSFEVAGEQDDNCNAVAVDSAGYVYIGGEFSHFLDFDPGIEYDVKVSNGEKDAYLIKLAPDGTYQWGLTWGGTGSDGISHIDIDAGGTIYVKGFYSGEIDFDPGSGVDLHTAEGGFGETIMCRFDTSGNYLGLMDWDLHPLSFTPMDSSGNFYRFGSLSGIEDVAPGYGVYELSQANGDMFICKLNQSGDVIWAQQWQSSTFTSVYKTLNTDETGAVYITGWRRLSDPGGQFDPIDPSREMFLRKYDSSGTFQYETVWFAENGIGPFEIDANEDGNVFITGWLFGEVDFANGPGIDKQTSTDTSCLFVLKTTPDGLVTGELPELRIIDPSMDQLIQRRIIQVE